MIKSVRGKRNIALFILSFIYIFVIGIFHVIVNMQFVYYTFISLIYFTALLSVRTTINTFFYLPAFLIIATWITEILSIPYFTQITGVLSTIFFLYVIVLLVIRVADSQTVGALEFLESVNVYLLFGIAGSILFGAVYEANNDAYIHSGETLTSQADFIYFSFVTMSTLGYGDITPSDSLARSLAIFFSVTGQLYLAMIIAMLVGKFIGQKNTANEKDH